MTAANFIVLTCIFSKKYCGVVCATKRIKKLCCEKNVCRSEMHKPSCVQRWRAPGALECRLRRHTPAASTRTSPEPGRGQAHSPARAARKTPTTQQIFLAKKKSLSTKSAVLCARLVASHRLASAEQAPQVVGTWSHINHGVPQARHHRGGPPRTRRTKEHNKHLVWVWVSMVPCLPRPALRPPQAQAPSSIASPTITTTTVVAHGGSARCR